MLLKFALNPNVTVINGGVRHLNGVPQILYPQSVHVYKLFRISSLRVVKRARGSKFVIRSPHASTEAVTALTNHTITIKIFHVMDSVNETDCLRERSH